MDTIKINSVAMLNLQLFAEGAAGAGDGGTASATQGVTEAAALPQQRKGVKSNPLADVKYGIQDDAAPDAGVNKAGGVDAAQIARPDREAEFEKLIKGEYKDLYDKRMSDTIQKRLKSTKETVDRYNELTPTLDMLAKKYGVEASDIKALNKAIQDDDSYYEEEALERNLTVQQLKEIRKMERENAELRQAMQEQETKENANRLYQSWMQQEQDIKQVYPSFTLEAEMANPQFQNLLRSGIDMKTAFEVIHKDEILPAAMQFAMQTAEQKITNKIIANGSRPAENGMNSQSASLVKSDVSQLSKADRAEIIRRVQRGERIRF